MIGQIASQAVNLWDDDVINAWLVFEKGQHADELGPVGCASGLTPVDEFFDYLCAEALGFATTRIPLGRN